MKGLEHGIYEIYWKSGGSSLAAVGYDTFDNNWMQPVNWISKWTLDWSQVRAYKMLIPNDYSKKTKAIKTDYAKVKINP